MQAANIRVRAAVLLPVTPGSNIRTSRRAAVAALALLAAWLAQATPSAASVVDAAQAEGLYKAGKYREALDAFKSLAADFREQQKDSNDFKVYREAAYLYDRMADCSFTIRDWDALKQNLDGLLVVGISERNLTQTQFAGALDSGVASATARYLATRVDEAVRINSIFQLKRSAGLVLFDSRGEGGTGALAIKQYQQLAALCQAVLSLEGGVYSLDTNALDERIEQFDEVYAALDQAAGIEALWEKYPPQSSEKEPPAA